MKKFLAILVGLGVLALLVEMDFYAYFADVESIPANTFHVGVLDVQLGYGAWVGDTEPNMDPGDSATLSIPVHNVGTLPLTTEISVDVEGNLAEAVRDQIEISPPSFDLGAGATTDVLVEIELPADLDPHYEGQGGMLFINVRAVNENFFDEERTTSFAFHSRAESPQVEILFPNEGTPVAGLVPIFARATDNFAIDRVLFYVDGQQIGEDRSDPYTTIWNAGFMGSGEHIITVEAYDGAGGQSNDSVRVSIRRFANPQGEDLIIPPTP